MALPFFTLFRRTIQLCQGCRAQSALRGHQEKITVEPIDYALGRCR